MAKERGSIKKGQLVLIYQEGGNLRPPRSVRTEAAALRW